MHKFHRLEKGNGTYLAWRLLFSNLVKSPLCFQVPTSTGRRAVLESNQPLWHARLVNSELFLRKIHSKWVITSTLSSTPFRLGKSYLHSNGTRVSSVCVCVCVHPQIWNGGGYESLKGPWVLHKCYTTASSFGQALIPVTHSSSELGAWVSKLGVFLLCALERKRE